MAKSRNQKRPVASNPPASPGKLPRSIDVAQSGDEHLLWSFDLFDDSDMWCDGSKKANEFFDVAKHLRDLQRLTWNAIQANTDRNHLIASDDLCKGAKDRLLVLRRDDVDELWSLHFNGKARLWGIRQQNVFCALWWDPLHQVCPSLLKHT